MNRRLYRCRHDRFIAGVAAGVAERFELDPTLVRVLWVLSIFFGGLGLLLYIVMAIVVPLEPEAYPAGYAPTGEGSVDASGVGGVTGDAGPIGPAGSGGWHATQVTHRHVTHDTGRLATWFGIVLILFGALALVDAILPDWADHGRFLWPAFILGIGAILVASAMRRGPTES